jgi:hypothetical protein
LAKFSSDENDLHHRTASGAEPEYTVDRRIHMTTSTAPRFDHTEGTVARTIEGQTAKLPSDTFLWASMASMAASAALHFTGNKQASVFVGQWAPTLLILGVYNKLVKQLGSDSLAGRANT